MSVNFYFSCVLAVFYRIDGVVTPQNVILTQNAITIAAKCNNIDAKCNKVFNAKCNDFSTQNVLITFLTHNVITQNVI